VAISEKIRNSVAFLSGVLYEDVDSGGGDIAKGSSGRLHVRTAAEEIGVLISSEVSNPSTTQGNILYPGGLLSAEISLLNLASSNIGYVYVVFDGLDDADAATKLATAGTRELIAIGETRTFLFSPETPIFRIDYVSNVASGSITGTGILRITAKGTA